MPSTPGSKDLVNGKKGESGSESTGLSLQSKNLPEGIGTPPSTPTTARSYRTKNSKGSATPTSDDRDFRKFSWSGRQSPLSEHVLNSLETEVISACQELQSCVKECLVSELLPHTADLMFLNITTLEGQAYCVELTLKGWRVCSMKHDSMNGEVEHLQLHIRYFETIYALLHAISPMYTNEFSSALATKLEALKQVEPGGPSDDGLF